MEQEAHPGAHRKHGLVSTAPEPIRAELRGLSVFNLLERASSYRPGAKRDIVSLTQFDRQANSALWHIVRTHMVYDPRTTQYINRRRTEGLTKKEAVRCLKRYVAREVFSLLPHDKLGLDSP